MEDPRRKHVAQTKKTRHLRLPLLLLLHALAIAAGLNLFALFHHVIPYYSAPEVTPVQLTVPKPTPAILPEPEETLPPATGTPVSESPALPVGSGERWSETFADKFTEGEVVQTDTSYRSSHICVELQRCEEENLVYHVAEIYVSDLKYLRTAFAEKGYGSRGMTADMAADHDAVVAISGDHYFARAEGVVVRNGMLWRETRFEDVCVLLEDGRMLTMDNASFDLDAVSQLGVWQIWSFGPMLLQNGKAMENFTSTVTVANPRSAIGYVEPGHYFFVQVDGRGGNNSRGMTMRDLALLFESLGCETAYNLDGGATAGMAWQGELLSYPYGRPVCDIIYVSDYPEDAED